MSGRGALLKRTQAGEIKPCASSQFLGLECLPVSRRQLRELWAYDNMRGNQTMGAPLRACSSEEEEDVQDTPETTCGMSKTEIAKLKNVIDEMWDRAKSIFEIYHDPLKPEFGYRMKVKESMPIKITLRSDDAFYFGWCAAAPQSGPCSHLYERSPVKPSGYMGGPASFINWDAGKQVTVKLSRPSSNIARYLVRLECSKLSGGVELKWNYGCEQQMPIQESWFNECCSVMKKPNERHQRRSNLVPFMNVENCILCGIPYACNNKERRVQRKQHFINSHADFLGSNWNGIGTYMQQEVDGNLVLMEADKLNALLHTLTKDLRWNVLPACKVFNMSEMNSYGEDHGALIQEFKNRSEMLKASGTLVLRALEVASTIERLSIEHLQAIPQSVWRVLKWKAGSQLVPGRYSVAKEYGDEHSVAVEAAITKFCVKNWAAK